MSQTRQKRFKCQVSLNISIFSKLKKEKKKIGAVIFMVKVDGLKIGKKSPFNTLLWVSSVKFLKLFA